MIDPWLSLGGLFAGVVVGLTGLGGAAIVTPMLLLLFNVPASIAVSTDLVSAAVMKPVGASVHIKRRTPYWPVVGWLSMGSVPGVLVGTWLFSMLADTDSGEGTLKRIIGVVLLVAVLITALRLRLRKYADDHSDAPMYFSTRSAGNRWAGWPGGRNPGRADVGGFGNPDRGLLADPVPRHAAQPAGGYRHRAGRAEMLVVGAIAHAGMGEVDWKIVVSLLIGQIPGVFIGARVSSRYNGQELRWLLLVLVAAGGVSLLGAPKWVGTSMTLIGVVGLGVPILVRAFRHAPAPPASTEEADPARAHDWPTTMRTIPHRTWPRTSATMPPMTSTAAMIHKMRSMATKYPMIGSSHMVRDAA